MAESNRACKFVNMRYTTKRDERHWAASQGRILKVGKVWAPNYDPNPVAELYSSLESWVVV